MGQITGAAWDLRPMRGRSVYAIIYVSQEAVTPMTKTPFIAAALISVSLLPASAGEIKALSEAGLNLPSIEVPAPEAPRSNQWLTLRKIQVNSAAPGMNDTLVGIVQPGQDMYAAVRELYMAGFKVTPYQDGDRLYVDVKGQDAADMAVGLARYYYITEVRVGQKVYDQLFGARNKSTYAVKQGTIKGGMNHSPVDIRINKAEWTIKGGMNHSPVDVRINHEEKTITGGANLSPVSLKFDWSTEEVKVYGGANQSPVNYTVNWKKGLLEGYASASPVKLEFDLGQGYADQTTVSIKGYAGHAPVDLVYNKVNGHIGGGMNHSPVDVYLVNCDLYDFLQYFFLFMKNPALQ